MNIDAHEHDLTRIPVKAITILTTGIAVSFLAFSLFVGGSRD